MIKKIAICALAAVILLSGCISFDALSGLNEIIANGEPENYEYPVGEIKEMRVALPCNIEYYSAPSDTVKLAVQPNIQRYISVKESNGVLTVETTRRVIFSNKLPTLTVSAPNLEYVKLSGAGAFTANDPIETGSMTFIVEGAVSGKARMDVDKLSIRIMGAGEMTLTGSADVAEYTMDGAGTLDALSLTTREAQVNMNGVGSVKVNCAENLRVNANGIGEVTYKGDAAVNTYKNGIVNIKKAE